MSCSSLKNLVLLCLALQAATNVNGGTSSISNHVSTLIAPTATRTVAAKKSVCPKPVTKTITVTSRTTSFTTIRPAPSTTTLTRTIIPAPSTTTLTRTIIPAPSTTTLTSTISPAPVTTTVITTIQLSCTTTFEPPCLTTTPSTPIESTTFGLDSGPIVPIGCESVAQVVGSWNGGFAVDFNVPFDTSMDSWTFDVQLSGNYYCLAIKGSVVESSSSFKVIGTSQSAGSVVTISANIGHSMGNVLTITAMLLNGQKVCGNSSVRRTDHQKVNFSRIRPIEGANTIKAPCNGCCCAFDNQCICKNLQAQPMTCNNLVEMSQFVGSFF